MPSYLELARQALAALPPGRRHEQNEVNEQTAAPWDRAEAERLLAELRQEAEGARRRDYGGEFPPSLGRVVADLLAVAEGYAANHGAEAARGWDALQLLAGVRPALLRVMQNAQHLRATQAATGHEPGEEG